MSRRYTPAGDDLAAILAGRVDTLERQILANTEDVTALGRGVSDLTVQIRHLTTTLTPASASTTDGEPDGEGEDSDEGEVVGQPDWFAITDPDEATSVLMGLAVWVQDIGCHHGIALPVPCWALHADVVADLLALTSERAGAYTNPQPTPVSEWLTRWLPATAERITTALTACTDQRGHHEQAITYDTTGFDPYSAGAWWALDRATPAPQAFALPVLT